MNPTVQIHRPRQIVALVTSLSVLLAPSVQLAQTVPAGQAAKPAQPVAKGTAPPAKTAPAASATSAASSQPVDGEWPRAYLSPAKAELLVYQPQILTWENQKHVVAYSAVSYKAPKDTKPSLGTIKLESESEVALDDRLVRLKQIRVTETHFPSLDRDQVRDVTEGVDAGIPDEDRVIALDRVLAGIDKSTIRPANVEGVKADPPTIFYSAKAAILVNIDGDPIWSPIKDNDLKFAVNTNWDLFHHEVLKTYFLRNEKVWLKAADLKGPWSGAGKLPVSFSKLPADDNWKDVKASLPGGSVAAASMPSIFLSMVPAELIRVNGAPKFVAVPNASPLLWLENTEADVFRLGSTGPIYYLVAGRWFSSPGFEGPWTFATTTLPEAFKKIALEHPRSRVLASVPGTSQATEAILLAQVPQTARVNKKQLQAPDVQFDGEPRFEAIPTTTVSRAVNTDKDIIKVGDLYYMCFDAVWFMSRAATGPWTVASTVPKEIYQIPASSPSHNVTYVTVVEDDDDDEWVTFAAVAGYTGMMVAYGCVVWGSGWYYPPYVGYGGFYPMYYPYYRTYGMSAWYNPWSGAYGRGAAWYGPYGGVGAAARYNPRTGTYSRGAAAWGPYGARGTASAYNPRTGTIGRTHQGSNVYGSWGSTAVQRGDQWAQTNRVTNRMTGTTTRTTQTSGGGEAISRRGGPAGNTTVGRTGSGDVYAGHDGNVYRRGDAGGWQKYDNGSWGNVDRPTPTTTDRAGTATTDRAGTATTDRAGTATTQQLDRDRAARAEGATRTRDYSTVRSSGGSSRSGSYRPSGGGRGGGGRRR
jgi:hypothetical protein